MRQELVRELENSEGKKSVLRVAKQIAKSRQDAVLDVNNSDRKIVILTVIIAYFMACVRNMVVYRCRGVSVHSSIWSHINISCI